MYTTLLATMTVKETEVVRRSVKQLQTAWSRAEEICGQQHGYPFALSIFHGPEWTYMA
jgi:hypothetical protein